MKLIFLGSGNAFTVGTDNYQSNMILELEENHCLLLDCGNDIRFSLYDQGLSYSNIEAVFISHLHADHVGGLEWLAFSYKFGGNGAKPQLFAAEDTISDLWTHVLSGGLSSLKDVAAELSTYFIPHAISKKTLTFSYHGHPFHLIPLLHVFNNKKPMPNYGLSFVADGLQVFISGDIQFNEQELAHYYDAADIIFHDCETTQNKSGVHPHYLELCTLPLAIKNKMWLYGYHAGRLPDPKESGFRGFIAKGQCFDFEKIDTLL
jgi:ribonuclease BN (tRNA processing enzyme)